jgi:hypothetical protein
MKTIFDKLHRFFNENWQLAVLDFKKGLWRLDPHIDKIPYLKAHNAKGRHIFMQPLDQPHYLLVDDLNWITVKRHHKLPDNAWKPGRMVVETSPHNFQVWIRSSQPLSLQQKRFLLKMLQSDPGADPNNRFGRCPGFRNRKDRYQSPDGKYPLCKLIWIDWLSVAHIPDHILQNISKSSSDFSHPPRGACAFKPLHPVPCTNAMENPKLTFPIPLLWQEEAIRTILSDPSSSNRELHGRIIWVRSEKIPTLTGPSPKHEPSSTKSEYILASLSARQ